MCCHCTEIDVTAALSTLLSAGDFSSHTIDYSFRFRPTYPSSAIQTPLILSQERRKAPFWLSNIAKRYIDIFYRFPKGDTGICFPLLFFSYFKTKKQKKTVRYSVTGPCRTQVRKMTK